MFVTESACPPSTSTDQAMCRSVHEQHDLVDSEQTESNPPEGLNGNEEIALVPNAAEAFRRDVIGEDRSADEPHDPWNNSAAFVNET